MKSRVSFRPAKPGEMPSIRALLKLYPQQLAQKNLPGISSFIVATSVVSVLLNLPNAVIITVMAESFPHRVRSLATSLAYTMPVTIFGGSTQFVVAWLTGITGTAMVVAWYASGALLIGCVAVLFLRETAPARLGHLDSARPTPSASHV